MTRTAAIILALLSCVAQASADDIDTTRNSEVYERHISRSRKVWNYLMPTQHIVQYAGNMGLISAGIGWDYGHHRHWETNLLVGYLPRYNSDSPNVTMTIKQNVIPWHVPINKDFTLDPLTTGLYFNTVFGKDFWSSEPDRYPDGYYAFLSTRWRINVFLGQRLTYRIPRNKRKYIKGVTAFYEVSTCDLFLRSYIQDTSTGFWNILSLSLGLKFQIL